MDEATKVGLGLLFSLSACATVTGTRTFGSLGAHPEPPPSDAEIIGRVSGSSSRWLFSSCDTTAERAVGKMMEQARTLGAEEVYAVSFMGHGKGVEDSSIATCVREYGWWAIPYTWLVYLFPITHDSDVHGIAARPRRPAAANQAAAPPPSRMQVDLDGYQGNSWGSSAAQVRAKFPAAIDGSDGLLIESTVAGQATTAVFQFVDDKLARVTVPFGQQHDMNPNAYLEDFYRMRDLLVEKYGDFEPIGPMIWLDPTLQRSGKDHWGTALIMGHLKAVSRWRLGRTIVDEGCLGGNLKARCALVYYSSELERLQRAHDTAKKIGDL